MRSSLEPSIDRHGTGSGEHRRKVFSPPESNPPFQISNKRILGGCFRFESNSRALIDLAEAAYGRLPSHAFPQVTVDFRVEMRLLPRTAGSWEIEPPAPRILEGGEHLRAEIDASNYVTIDPRRRCALIVASEDMLQHAYHLRCELIEFAVFVLASRAIGLVPLHAACVGRDGRGLLLLGRSGAGKSTLVLHGLLKGLDLLAEDAVFVRPSDLLATGVPNYLHLRADALACVEDHALRTWIVHAPIIRRRSGVRKLEVDLRSGFGRPASSPLALVGAVFISGQAADHPGAMLTRLDAHAADRLFETEQHYAPSQPGWQRFKREIIGRGVHQLRRGRHPRDSVDALCGLLD